MGAGVCVWMQGSEYIKQGALDRRSHALERRVRHRLLLPPEPELLPVQDQDHHLRTFYRIVGCMKGDVSQSVTHPVIPSNVLPQYAHTHTCGNGRTLA